MPAMYFNESLLTVRRDYVKYGAPLFRCITQIPLVEIQTSRISDNEYQRGREKLRNFWRKSASSSGGEGELVHFRDNTRSFVSNDPLEEVTSTLREAGLFISVTALFVI